MGNTLGSGNSRGPGPIAEGRTRQRSAQDDEREQRRCKWLFGLVALLALISILFAAFGLSIYLMSTRYNPTPSTELLDTLADESNVLGLVTEFARTLTQQDWEANVALFEAGSLIDFHRALTYLVGTTLAADTSAAGGWGQQMAVFAGGLASEHMLIGDCNITFPTSDTAYARCIATYSYTLANANTTQNYPSQLVFFQPVFNATRASVDDPWFLTYAVALVNATSTLLSGVDTGAAPPGGVFTRRRLSFSNGEGRRSDATTWATLQLQISALIGDNQYSTASAVCRTAQYVALAAEFDPYGNSTSNPCRGLVVPPVELETSLTCASGITIDAPCIDPDLVLNSLTVQYLTAMNVTFHNVETVNTTTLELEDLTVTETINFNNIHCIGASSSIPCSQVETAIFLANDGTPFDIPNTLVKRDALGNFAATQINATTFSATGADVNTTALEASVAGDTYQRFAMTASGAMLWGNGSGVDAGPVANLYRSGIGMLTTNAEITFAPVFTASGGTTSFSSFPTWDYKSAAPGATYSSAFLASAFGNLTGTNAVATVVVDNPGIGYALGDFLTPSGGNSNSQVRVTSVDINGAILSLLITRGGSGYTNTNGILLTGGTGGNATANITVSSSIFNVANLFLGSIAPINGQAMYSTATIGTCVALRIQGPVLGSGPLILQNNYGMQYLGSNVACTTAGAFITGQLSGGTTSNTQILLGNTVGASTANTGIIVGIAQQATSNIGIDVRGALGGTTNAGVKIAQSGGGSTPAGALTTALWLSGSGTAGGILWGNDLGPTANLYRSGAGTLRTDGILLGNPLQLAATPTGTSAAIIGSPQWNQTTGTTNIGVGVSGSNALNGLQLSTNGVSTFVISNGGTGYLLNDLLTVTGGSGTAQVKVTSLGGGGVVLTVVLTLPGSGYTTATEVPLTGGSGTSATLNITATAATPFTTLVGVQGQAFSASGSVTPTVTTAAAFQTVNPVLGSGPVVVTNLLGIDSPANTIAATNSYGLRINAPTGGTAINNALNFVAGTTAAAGITFGADAQPSVTLYRAVANTLRTDSIFQGFTFRTTATTTTAITGSTQWNQTSGTTPTGVGVLGTNSLNGLQLSTNGISTFVISNGGTGYAVNNLLTVTGGSGTAQVKVTSVSSGVILTVVLTLPGSGYTTATEVPLTGGSGTSATLNITATATTPFTTLVGVQGQGFVATGSVTPTVTTAVGFQTLAPVLGSGPTVVTNIVGLDVPTHAIATTNSYGLRVASPTGGTALNQAINLVDTTGVAAGGITWGADAQPTPNMYRSAINTLRTDGLFQGKAFRTASTTTTAITGSPQWNQTTGTTVTGVGVLGTNSLSGLQLSTNGISTFVIASGGSGYALNDLLTVTGGSGTAQVKVTSLSSGVVLTVVLTRPGSGYSTSTEVSLTGGTGSLATLNITAINTTPFTTVVGVQGQGFDATGGFVTPTVTTAIGFQTLAPVLGSGPVTVTNIVGLDAPAHAIATTNAYGLRIAAPTGGTAINNALNFVANTIAAGGITFGADAQPAVTLYRSAANTLKTDGIFLGNAFRVAATSTTAITGSVQWNQTTGTTTTGVGVLGTNSLNGLQLSTNGISTFVIANGGTGYAVNNLLTVTGGSGTAQVKVTSVSSGVILTVVLMLPGSGYSTATEVALTGGAGSSATLNITAVNTTPFTTVVGVQGQGFVASGSVTPTVTSAIGFQTVAPVLGSGPVVVTNIIGLDVPAHAIATTNSYGIRLAAPTGGTTLNNALNFVANTIAAGGITFGADATGTNLYRSAANIIKSDSDVGARHLYGFSASIPTAVAGTGAGTGPTITVAAGSTDCKMQITVLTGTSCTAAGIIMTVTYNSAFINTLNKGVIFSPAGPNAAGLSGATMPYVTTEALGSFVFNAGPSALADATSYTWNFQACT